uniref:Uncharacterized protein n=1 Tax=Cyprinodon variegatus TaxID=28743 RepID=A0A3Q2DLX6_CYPVA
MLIFNFVHFFFLLQNSISSDVAYPVVTHLTFIARTVLQLLTEGTGLCPTVHQPRRLSNQTKDEEKLEGFTVKALNKNSVGEGPPTAGLFQQRLIKPTTFERDLAAACRMGHLSAQKTWLHVKCATCA